MDWINLVSTTVLIITLLVMAFQTHLLRKQVKEDHEWRRREKGLLFSQIYSEPLRDARQKINAEFGHIQARKNPLTTDELNRAFQKDPTLQDEVNFLLSYLENIGLAVRHNIASFEVVYDLLANTYLKYYFLFQPYIKEAKEHNPRLWDSIEFLVHEIEKERRKRSELPVRLPRLG
jgi:hypothetical protein